MRDNDSARLPNAVVDDLFIQWNDRPQIDHFDRTASGLQLAHGFEHCVNRAAPRDDRELLPFLANSATTERNKVVCIRLLGLRLGPAVKALMLQKQHWIFG